MRKLILASSVALLALSGAALAQGGGNRSLHNSHVTNGTGSVKANLDITRTKTQTNTDITKYQQDNYNGIGTHTNAEHGGVSDIKTSGKAGAASLGVNAAVANANGAQGSIDLSGSLTNTVKRPFVGNVPSTTSLTGNLTGTALTAGSSSVSGSGLVAGAAGGGSVNASSAGYGSGSAVAQREWGSSNQMTSQQTWQNVRNLSAQGSVSRTR